MVLLVRPTQDKRRKYFTLKELINCNEDFEKNNYYRFNKDNKIKFDEIETDSECEYNHATVKSDPIEKVNNTIYENFKNMPNENILAEIERLKGSPIIFSIQDVYKFFYFVKSGKMT